MASPVHLEILESGAEVWNQWRDSARADHPDLRKAELAKYDLTKYDLANANLANADLSSCVMHDVSLEGAHLTGTRLRGANLHSSDLSGAHIIRADFRSAVLIEADFSFADITATSFDDANLEGTRFAYCELTGVTMRQARLELATFVRTQLMDVDFTGAVFGGTTFATTELRHTSGLDTIEHEYGSSIGLDSFFLTGGLPDVFLRGVGLPEEFIVYAGSLVGRAIEYYSCFISYSSGDEEFARRLHADLQARNVRTWFAPEDLRIGDRFRARIDDSIRLHDKLVLVLSQAATDSAWVEKEVETAFARERREKRDVLFPIRIDDSVFDTRAAWASDIANTRHIGDFCHWKEHDAYAAALDRLIRDLKKEGPIVMR